MEVPAWNGQYLITGVCVCGGGSGGGGGERREAGGAQASFTGSQLTPAASIVVKHIFVWSVWRPSYSSMNLYKFYNLLVVQTPRYFF